MTDTPTNTSAKKVWRILRPLIAIVVLVPVFALVWLATSQTGLRWAYDYALPYVPGELKLASLDGSLIGPITVKDMEYTQDGARITLDELTLDWSPATLFAAHVNIDELHVQALDIVLPASNTTTATTTSDQPLTLPDVHLPWRVMLDDVVIDGVTLHQNEQDFALQQVRLDATTLFSQLDITQLTVRADQFELTMNGELELAQDYTHDLNMQWQARLPSAAAIKGTGHLQGDLNNTRLQQTLSGPVKLSLDATLSELLTHPRWQARAKARTANVAALHAALPAASATVKLTGKGDLHTASLSGTAKGNYPEIGPFTSDFAVQRLTDNSLWIEHLMLQAPATDTQLQVRGQWMPGDNGGTVDVALQWQNLSWPPKQKTWFDSAVGSAWIVGSLQHYQAGLATDRPWPQSPPSDWYASVDGTVDGLNFHSLRVHTPKGDALATGALDWSPRLAWQAKVIASDVNPAGLFPQIPQLTQWPGQIKATINSKGRTENGKLTTTTDITKLTGTLRGYPVSLRSRATWSNNGVDIAQFDFHSGTAQVTAQGRVADNLQLDWSIAANNVAELYPQAKGQLNARGRLTGSQSLPLLNATVTGKALALPGYAIGAIDATLAIDLFHWQELGIKIAAQSVTIPGYALQSLDVNVDKQRLKAKAVSDTETALLELQGEQDANGWRVNIERADVQSRRFNDWQLQRPAALTISKAAVHADALCWHNPDKAQLCATLHREIKPGEQGEKLAWQSRLDIKQMPLALLSPWLNPYLTISGVANATAELQFAMPDQLLGHAVIELPPGALGYPLLEGEAHRWDYRHGKLTITLDEKGLEASADLALTNDDHLQGRVRLPGAKLLALDVDKQPLEARAQLSLHDAGFIEALVTDVQGVHGEVALKVAATGTLAQPTFSGQAHLRNGGLRVPRLGLDVTQLTLDGESDDQHRLHFKLAAHSGDGDLTIDGHTTLDPSAGWPTELSIKGKAFEVSRIPEARVVVSPDLRITLQQRRIDIQGDVHVPYAKLQPKDLTTATRVSPDAVIVGDQQLSQEKWVITSRVRLTLGEQVRFYGFGFEGRFGGNLLITDEPGQLTTASGELSIPEGHYRAYGQRLDVEHGRLLYTGGPLTNPGLDLTAVRHVNEVTAGLRVRGSLSQPQIELFALPAMGQTDTLSYLLLGRPMENATGEEGAMMAKAALALSLSGGNRLARSLTDQFGLDEMRVESSDKGDQASLVMGRYLSPKIYVSYGVGLIEAFNTFTVRYQISSKWQLKAESGEYQGADLLYTIER